MGLESMSDEHFAVATSSINQDNTSPTSTNSSWLLPRRIVDYYWNNSGPALEEVNPSSNSKALEVAAAAADTEQEANGSKAVASSYSISSKLRSWWKMSSSIEQEPLDQPEEERKGMKVLFLSSDTGGGHRASAESLAKQFQLLYPDTTYVIYDLMKNDGTPPYSSAVSWYKHLSANPRQWRLVYEISNSKAFEMLADAHVKFACERGIRKRIMAINPDVVISVHPLMCNVPIMSCNKISQKTGKHLPMFTVVTDLGSAHSMWFANGVEKMFVGSEQCWKLAQVRGKVPDEKLVLAGLPIRHDFAIQAEKLGDRMSEEGRQYQRSVREDLGLVTLDKKTVLVMGGGEGVGSLSNIVNALYVEFVREGIDAHIMVVCGRNEKLKADLEVRNWDDVLAEGFKRAPGGSKQTTLSSCIAPASTVAPGCMDGTGTNILRKILSASSLQLDNPLSAPTTESASNAAPTPEPLPKTKVGALEPSNEEGNAIGFDLEQLAVTEDEGGQSVETETAVVDGSAQKVEAVPVDEDKEPRVNPTIENEPKEALFDSIMDEKPRGNVVVTGLGFVQRMAEYMVAADVLVTKAGPGTISEAAAVSLPVMLTSFLPGQEEGNIDYVIDGGFGAFVSDRDPLGIAEELTIWLKDPEKMERLSKAAKAKGSPHAASVIAKAIGDSTLRWKEINEERAQSGEIEQDDEAVMSDGSQGSE